MLIENAQNNECNKDFDGSRHDYLQSVSFGVFSLNFTDTKFFYNFLDADGLHPKYFMSVVLKGFKIKRCRRPCMLPFRLGLSPCLRLLLLCLYWEGQASMK